MRYYNIDGKEYPSVTTVLSILAKPEPLIRWIANQGYDNSRLTLKKAGERGTRVHNKCESILSGEKTTMKGLKKDERILYKGFKLWVKVTKPIIVQPELTVYSKKYKYAGTLDLVCLIKKELCIIDYKTSNRLQRTYGLQLAAYAKAYEEMTGKEIKKTYILHLHTQYKEGYKLHEVKEPLSIFLTMLKLWKWQYKKKAPKK